MIRQAMINLEENVAISSTFQSWIGATGTPTEKLAAAKARIYQTAVSSPTLPFALIEPGPHMEAEKHGEPNTYLVTGTLNLSFYAEPTDTDDATAIDAFLTIVDAIADEITDLYTNPYLIITRLATDGPRFAELDQKTKVIECLYEIEWQGGK